MTSTATPTKAEQMAKNIQAMLDGFWKSNAENVRLRAEVDILRGKIRSLESPNKQMSKPGSTEAGGKP